MVVKPPGEDEIRIDERFHLDHLAPIDPLKVAAKATEWDFPESSIGRPCWKCWEWKDEEGHDQATGSRVRLWFPAHSDQQVSLPLEATEAGLCRYHDLAAFVEPQLENGLRARVLVQGMHVQESDLAIRRLQIAPGVGTRAWVDLRGRAVPGLTTDRRQMLVPENEESLVSVHWENELGRLFQRCIQALTSELAAAGSSTWHNMAAGFRWTGGYQPGLPPPPNGQFSLVGVAKRSASSARGVFDDLLQLHAMLLQDPARDLDRDLLALDRSRGRARRSLARAFVGDNVDLALFRPLNLAHDSDLDYNLMGMTLGSRLQEGFRPDLSRSWPLLGLQGLRGQIGDAALAAPGRVIFACESDGRAVRDADPDGTRCRRLIELGYDLVFPMVAIPLGHLRQACPTWRADRRVQPLGVAPFLFPEFHDVWSNHVETLRSIFGVPKIYALYPRFELWDKPFDDWSDEDWKTCGRSALWEVTTGRVLWADGAYPIERMPEIGRPALEYFKLK